MSRKVLSGLVLVGAVLVSLSQAQAATEVMRLPATNTFANAISIDPVTGATTGIFVSRHKTDRGGPVDTLFYIAQLADGSFISGGGVLPKNAFHVDGQGATLDVDVHDMFRSVAGVRLRPRKSWVRPPHANVRFDMCATVTGVSVIVLEKE